MIEGKRKITLHSIYSEGNNHGNNNGNDHRNKSVLHAPHKAPHAQLPHAHVHYDNKSQLSHVSLIPLQPDLNKQETKGRLVSFEIIDDDEYPETPNGDQEDDDYHKFEDANNSDSFDNKLTIE